MGISLIGIIVVQSVWISNAIGEGKKELALHVNNALNRINEEINQDEAEFFINSKLGGVDSLLQDVFVIDSPEQISKRVVLINDDNSKNESSVQISYTTESSNTITQHTDDEITIITEHPGSSHIELKMENIDSIIEAELAVQKIENGNIENISQVIEHFTYEKLFSGNLSDRLTKKQLENELKKAFKLEALQTNYEYAIFDSKEGEFKQGFTSSKFEENLTENNYKIPLFQNDRIEENRYELFVQIENEDNYVWGKIRLMVFLACLFSLLILICFGYSVYYIFKQKKISQIKNDFINNMTHELKTPLASISLAATSIKHPQVISKPDEIERFVSIIESEKDRMNTHVERVLDIAALDSSELKLNFANIDLVDVIKDSLKTIKLPLAERNGHCIFNTTLSAAKLTGDQFHLTNVIINILDNSVKYSDGAPQIEIDLKANKDNYVISISDKGIGMNAKAQKLAFDKFYRAEGGNIHTQKGFGLGLSYVKSIIDKHGGQISLKSALGKGTNIILEIPSNLC